MNKYILSVVSLLVGLGFGYGVFHNGANQSELLGSNVRTIASNFVNGFYAGSTDQFAVDSSGNASTTGTVSAVGITNSGNSVVGGTLAVTGTSTLARLLMSNVSNSSTSPAALGSGTVGKFTIPASAAVVGASTTAVKSSSLVLINQTATTTIPNVTCNTAVASGTLVTTLTPGNGFVVRTQIAPTTNPFCYDYVIINTNN